MGCQTIHYFPAIANHWLSAPTKAATAKPQSSTSKDKEQDKNKDKDTDNEKDKGCPTLPILPFFLTLFKKGGRGVKTMLKKCKIRKGLYYLIFTFGE